MATVVVRFIKESRRDSGVLDSAQVLAEQDLASTGSAVTTTITATGEADEICVVYAIGDNQRVGFGEDATTSSGPVAFSGQPTAFRDVKKGDTVSVITAT